MKNRKRSIEVTTTPEGVTIAVAGETVADFAIPEELIGKFLDYGVRQKFADVTSGSKSDEEDAKLIRALAARIASGQWTAERSVRFDFDAFEAAIRECIEHEETIVSVLERVTPDAEGVKFARGLMRKAADLDVAYKRNAGIAERKLDDILSEL